MTNLPDKKPALEEDLDRLFAIPLAGGDIQELADGIKAHRKAYTLSIVPEKEKDLPADGENTWIEGEKVGFSGGWNACREEMLRRLGEE